MPTDPHHTPIILQSSSSQPQKTHKSKKPTRKVTEVPQPSDPIEYVADEAVHKELRDSLVRAVTTASSLVAEQDNGNINRTQSKATPNESSSKRTSSCGGPKCQEAMRDTIAQTRVFDLEKTKTTQANVIDSLKTRVKKLEKRNRLRTHKLKRLYKVGLTTTVESSDEESLGEDASKQGRRIDDIDADEDITLVNVKADAEMFDADKDLGGEEVFVEQEIVTDKEKINEVTLAQALVELKTSKPKAKWVVIQEPNQIRLDEEAALKLQAEFDKEQRLVREKAKKELEANIALIETWDDVQAKIDADHQLAERLQAEEQQELTDEEKATLFMQFLEKRRKFFAAKRAEKKRNKPPTQAQKRKIMCTYLKNIEGYTLKQLKEFEFDKVQEMFDKAFKRINTFEDFRTELVQGQEKEKRA
nr:hypothetical protein [Tanacetum cinerariifolium]